MDPFLQLFVALPLAVLMITASQHKLIDRTRFTAQLKAYALLPAPLAGPAARTLPWLELGAGLALVIPATRPAGGLAIALLLMGYALAMFINLQRGRRQIDCGCGGPPQPLSGWLVGRNLVLAACALLLLLPTAARDLTPTDGFVLLLLTALVSISYLAMGQLLSNFALLKGWNHHES